MDQFAIPFFLIAIISVVPEVKNRQSKMKSFFLKVYSIPCLLLIICYGYSDIAIDHFVFGFQELTVFVVQTKPS
jgi:branched-subunit amino acid transport protein AzlD